MSLSSSCLAKQGNEPGDLKPVTDICLGCICEAISGCNRTLTCNGDVCGLFRITWAYWADGGKPTVNSELPGSDTGKKISIYWELSHTV